VFPDGAATRKVEARAAIASRGEGGERGSVLRRERTARRAGPGTGKRVVEKRGVEAVEGDAVRCLACGEGPLGRAVDRVRRVGRGVGEPGERRLGLRVDALELGQDLVPDAVARVLRIGVRAVLARLDLRVRADRERLDATDGEE